MDKIEFLQKFGGVYEHSPWVAEAAFDAGGVSFPVEAEPLSEQFKTIFLASAPDRQLATLRAHPQLACALAEPAELTADSVSEQAGAGLDQCTEAELAEFGRLNSAYVEKFGFPFIIAVRGRDRHSILNLFRMRLQNDAVLEYQTALLQVCQIARLRIRGMLDV